jgi:hypothetical protein
VVEVATSDSNVLDAVEAAYRQHFEVAPSRASVSFLGVEPVEILRYHDGDRDHYLSLGMSRRPMTDPAAAVLDDESGPRAELMLTAAGLAEGLWRNIAVLAATPAVEGTVYAVGNRVDLGQPLCSGSRCTGALVSAGPLDPIRLAEAGEITVLQLLPATSTELAWARIHGSDALRELWATADTVLTDLNRDAVALP